MRALSLPHGRLVMISNCIRERPRPRRRPEQRAAPRAACFRAGWHTARCALRGARGAQGVGGCGCGWRGWRSGGRGLDKARRYPGAFAARRCALASRGARARAWGARTPPPARGRRQLLVLEERCSRARAAHRHVRGRGAGRATVRRRKRKLPHEHELEHVMLGARGPRH